MSIKQEGNSFVIYFEDLNKFSMKNTAYEKGIKILGGAEKLKTINRLYFSSYAKKKDSLFISGNDIFFKYGVHQFLLFNSDEQQDVVFEFKKMEEFFNMLVERENARLKEYVGKYVSKMIDERNIKLNDYIERKGFERDLLVIEDYLKTNSVFVIKGVKDNGDFNVSNLSDQELLFEEIMKRLSAENDSSDKEKKVVIRGMSFVFHDGENTIFVIKNENF